MANPTPPEGATGGATGGAAVRSLAGDLAALTLEAATAAAWRQWTALGAMGRSQQNPAKNGAEAATVIDPEALLLASLALLPHERRLGDFLGWWAGTGAPLLSVQRTRTLLAQMPEAVGAAEPTASALAAFAASALRAGDRRWRRYAGEPPLEGRPGKGAERPVLMDPAALLLRLRAGFGVSAKADVLAVLLGLRGRPTPVKALAGATGYSTVAVRAAVEEMALARFVEDTGDYPAAYRATGLDRWARLLLPELAGVASGSEAVLPAWGYWGTVYAFLLGVAAWGHRVDTEGWSAYVAASRARDLVERHGPALRPLDLPLPEDRLGVAYLAPFEGTVRWLVGWTRRHA